MFFYLIMDRIYSLGGIINKVERGKKKKNRDRMGMLNKDDLIRKMYLSVSFSDTCN